MPISAMVCDVCAHVLNVARVFVHVHADVPEVGVLELVVSCTELLSQPWALLQSFASRAEASQSTADVSRRADCGLEREGSQIPRPKRTAGRRRGTLIGPHSPHIQSPNAHPPGSGFRHHRVWTFSWAFPKRHKLWVSEMLSSRLELCRPCLSSS